MTSRHQYTVCVVDSDEMTCQSLKGSLPSAELRCFGSGREFLRFYRKDLVGCLIVDVSLPDMTGMDLRDRLLEQYCTLPLIFLGTGSSVAQAVDVMRKGAIDFLDKPVQPQDLLNAISAALEWLEIGLSHHSQVAAIGDRLAQLTARERQVFDAVVAGLSNRAIAEELGVSQKTVETHRLRMMNKMQTKSLAELVRMSLRLQEFQEVRLHSDLVRQAATSTGGLIQID